MIRSDFRQMHQKAVLRVVSKFLIPYILLFGLYVQWHGDFGPGGGFQAGVIFASAFILYALIFGVDKTRKAIPAWATRLGLVVGVWLYAGVGVATMLMGENYLDYKALSETATAGQHIGILLVELGVGITVFSAMITIYIAFAGRRR